MPHALSSHAARAAGFWKREVAYLIDTLLLAAALNVLLAVPMALLGAFAGEPVLDLLLPLVNAALDGHVHELEAALWPLLRLLGWLLLVGTVAYALLGWLYFALLESSPLQATLGKRALGIRAVAADGSQLSFARASARFFAAGLSWLTLNLGHAMAAWTRDKRALHDYVAATRVENVDPTATALPQWAQVLVVLQLALVGGSLLALLILTAALLAVSL